AAHCRTNFSIEQCRRALGDKFRPMNCDLKAMTDPCGSALRRLIAMPAARTGWRERLRCSSYLQEPQRRSPVFRTDIPDQHTAGISLSPLPKASLLNPLDCRFPPVILDAENAETRVVAVRTISRQS
ncbi:MAG: hypothetical protein ACKO3T_26350, partial [Planctomycetaceae bacterium]